MQEEKRKANLNMAIFDRWPKHFREKIREYGAPPAQIQDVLRCGHNYAEVLHALWFEQKEDESDPNRFK
jgi:hypothetical protein